MEKVIFDYSCLLGKIKESGNTQESVAEGIKMSASALNAKLTNKTYFTQAQIIKVATLLGLDDLNKYFFTLKIKKT